MAVLDTSILEGDAPPSADLAEAGIYPTAEVGFDHGLVALAMGVPYWLVEADGGVSYRLLVPFGAAEAVREQLAIYERESVGWPPPQPRMEGASAATRHGAGVFAALLWALAVVAGFAAQGRWPELTTAWALDARAVFADGEIWRAATALFLHADLGHLSSNILGGVFLFSAVFAAWGACRGALWLGMAAMAGNLAAAAIHYPAEYRSLGASTAVFAALGLLTGRAVRLVWQNRPARLWRAVAVPLAAGITVLALFGAGEQRVDVLAHATGFGAGLIVALAATRTEQARWRG